MIIKRNDLHVSKHVTESIQNIAPAEVSKKRSNFWIRQFKEKRYFNIAANLTLKTMVSFIILLIARTSRRAYVDRQTDTHTHTHETTTVTLAAHACQGLIKSTKVQTLNTIWQKYWQIFGLKTPLHAYILGEHTVWKMSCIRPTSKVRGLSIEPLIRIDLLKQVNIYYSKRLISKTA